CRRRHRRGDRRGTGPAAGGDAIADDAAAAPSAVARHSRINTIAGTRRSRRKRSYREGETRMPFYERGDVRIHYEDTGTGFPLLLIPGGGLNATIAHLKSPFDAIATLKSEYRCIAMDLRNAKDGQSSGPLEIDRPWDSYADDQLGLMDHLGI